MAGLRQILFSLTLCIVPILGAPLIGAMLYPDTVGRQSVRSSEAHAVSSSSSKQVEVEGDEVVVPDASGVEPNWLSAGSSSDFDPNAQADFILTLRVRANSEPRLSKRQGFIRKYNQAGSKAHGWAFALKRFDASIRPELYMNDEQGKGEWYTFESVSVQPGKWLQFFLVRRVDGSTGLFFRRENEDVVTIRSLGGYDTAQIDISSNQAELFVTPPLVETPEFKGEVEDIMVIRPEGLPRSEPKLVKLLAEYVLKPESTFSKEEVKLFVRTDMRDHSVFAHPLTAIR